MAPRHRVRSRLRRSWPQRLGIALGALVTIACVAVATAVAYVYWKTGTFARADVVLDEVQSTDHARNYLIIGSDERTAEDLVSDPLSGGRRSDTIIVMRVDPADTSMQMLSFPRDLYVPIAGRSGSDRINAAYGYGRQVLIDTIRQDFGIDIHNYIEVDFNGFKNLVNALGGVPVYLPHQLRDTHSFLEINQTGCVNLRDEQALAFARSRYLEYQDDDGRWREDGRGDLGRIERQQFFVRRLMGKALGMNLTDLSTFTELLDVAVESITLDRSLDRGDLFRLVQRIKGLGDNLIETYSLPVDPAVGPGGASILELDEREARPILDVFRDQPAEALPEREITVDVLNGTGVEGRALLARDALAEVGFVPGIAGNPVPALAEDTTIRFAPGSEPAADVLARHLTSTAELEIDDSLRPDHVVLTMGSDFTTIMERARPAEAVTGSTTTSTARATTTTTTEPTTSSTSTPGRSTTPGRGGRATSSTTTTPDDLVTTTTVPGATTTTVVGVGTGEPPAGTAC
ncbi:MAG: LCP family protein [Acidimicrobiia bacterium]